MPHALLGAATSSQSPEALPRASSRVDRLWDRVDSQLTMQSPVSTFVARTVVGTALRRPWPILVLLYCCAVAAPAAAQSALTGIVHDPSGRVAVDATITVYDLAGTHQ